VTFWVAGRLVCWWRGKVDFGVGARSLRESGCLGRDGKVWVSLVGLPRAFLLLALFCFCATYHP
jgi:hypothetical protein